MPRRRKSNVPEGPKPNDAWEYVKEIQINGRNVVPGTELKIKGERGRYRFMHLIRNGDKEWIDVWGGPKGADQWRSFTLDRVTRVHYKNQTFQNLAVQYKEKKKSLKEENPSEKTS